MAGTFVLQKDNETKYIYDLRTVPGKEDWVILPSSLPDKRGIVFKFYDVKASIKFQEIFIPFDGPESLKGGSGSLNLVLDANEILVVGRANTIGLYDSLGKLSKKWNVQLDISQSREDYVQLEGRKGLLFQVGDWVQIGQNPSNLFRNLDPKSGITTSEFPLDFNRWLTRVNLKTGQVAYSDFEAPGGYAQFRHDLTSTYLMGAYDTKREQYYLGWPYSDSLYRLVDLELSEKFSPKTDNSFRYKPSEVQRSGRFMVWNQPKEASSHIFLLYYDSNDLFLRASKTHESGEGETKFSRTKHYVLAVFSGEWECLGEYFFDFEGELDLENWFLTGGRLFINKPEQPNEDHYEFYRLDLSKIKKP